MLVDDPHKNLAPGFKVAIAGSELGVRLTELVGELEYESVDGIVDEARMTIANPDLALTDSPIWQPGNELDIWFGYGAELGYIGRTIIVRPELRFPSDGMPTIQIKGFTKDWLMMRNTPAKEEASTRDFESVLIHEAIERVSSRPAYSFDSLDIDQTPGRYSSPQKADMSDYEYVKGLANVVGYLFWVDYTLDKKWTLHFKDPGTLSVQDVEYTFRYNQGDKSTLLEFEQQLMMDDAVTKIQVQSRDPESGKLFIAEFSDVEEAPDAKYAGDPTEKVADAHTTAGALVKFFFGDYAIDVVADKKFKTEAELRWWADQYFRKRRENFIIGRGTCIGVENLFAHQTHRLEGLAKSLDGRYYFARVRHSFSADQGYLCDFTVRKEF